MSTFANIRRKPDDATALLIKADQLKAAHVQFTRKKPKSGSSFFSLRGLCCCCCRSQASSSKNRFSEEMTMQQPVTITLANISQFVPEMIVHPDRIDFHPEERHFLQNQNRTDLDRFCKIDGFNTISLNNELQERLFRYKAQIYRRKPFDEIELAESDDEDVAYETINSTFPLVQVFFSRLRGDHSEMSARHRDSVGSFTSASTRAASAWKKA